MSLIIKVGGKETNSFITVEEADELVALLPDGDTVWSELTPAEKEYRLKLAAHMIGYLRLRGMRAYQGQRLCFPRTHQTNVRTIPTEVKEAQAFIAVSVVHRGLENRPSDPAAKETTNDISRLSLGGALSVSFHKGKTRPSDSLSKMIQSAQFPALIGMKPHLTQVKGVICGSDTVTLSTTTTTTTTV